MPAGVILRRNHFTKPGSRDINVPPKLLQSSCSTLDKGTPCCCLLQRGCHLTNNAAKMSNAYSHVAPGCCAASVNCLVFFISDRRIEGKARRGAPDELTLRSQDTVRTMLFRFLYLTKLSNASMARFPCPASMP